MARLVTALQQRRFAGRDARVFKDDCAKDGSFLNFQGYQTIKNDGDLRKMSDVEHPRPGSMGVKMRVTLFGCLLVVLQLMLFDYLVGTEKNEQEVADNGGLFQQQCLKKSLMVSH